MYDRVGFRSYHIAEHHSTPLGMAPSPNLFLSAIASQTTRLRFGPLVFALPLYHPLRLVQEICMLDQLSRGRLEIGFGRGASAIEASYFGNDHTIAEPVYREYLDLILAGMAEGRLNGKGDYYDFDRRALDVRPLSETTPATVVRRPFDRKRRAGRAHGQQYREPRYRRGDGDLRQPLSRRVGRGSRQRPGPSH